MALVNKDSRMSAITLSSATFLIWAYFMLLLTANIASGLGVAWGRRTSQILLPSAVVDMLMANGVEKVKFFSNNPGVLDAFMWSNISIMISCPNGEIKLIDEEEKAKAWVKENVTDLVSNGLKITYVRFLSFFL